MIVNDKNNNNKKNILELLKQQVKIIDGAMGTMLQSNGLKASDCPEMWNINHAHVVQQIHYDYLKAGADIILTNTFGANGIKLRKFDQEERITEINQQAIQLACKALDDYQKKEKNDRFLAVSIGPTGDILEPYGTRKKDDAYQGYQNQVKAINETLVDMIILETFYNLDEIKIALRAVKENSHLPVFASMSFDKSLKTIYGISPEIAVETLLEEGADGIGANCGGGPEILYDVMIKMRPITDAPLLVEPNAGMPYLKNNQVIYPASPQKMAEYANQFKQLGINMIGGCCGTTPEHIKAMVLKIREK